MDLLHFLKSWNLWATLAILFHICFASDNSTSRPQQQQEVRPEQQKAHESPPLFYKSNNYMASKTYYPLIVSVYEVTQDSVEIDWSPNQGEKWSLGNCQLIYGPLDDPSRLEVLSNFLPENHSFRVTGLAVNVSYHCHLVCVSKGGDKLESNTLRFTTGSTAPSSPAHFVSSSDSFRGFDSSDFRSASSSYSGSPSSSSDDDGSSPGRSSVQSSSVVLGAVCGIVGFVIINATVVMAVRRYSQRQVRRRRILNLHEVREYDDFPYLRGLE